LSFLILPFLPILPTAFKKIFSLSPNFLGHICQPYFPFACFAGCFVTSGNKVGEEESSTVLSTDIKIEMDVAVEEDEQQLCTCTAVKVEGKV
jgi:hypothetical protein